MPRNLLPALFFFAMIFLSPVLMAQKLVGQAEHLKKFPQCFEVKAPQADEMARVRKLVDDPPCFRLCCYTNPKGYFLLAFFPDYFLEELRSCYFSQSSILGAMQMYNAEHVVPLRRLTSEMINSQDSPLMPDYLKHPFPMPSAHCRYESIGDLIHGNLIIYCTFHGAPQPGHSKNKSKPATKH